LYFVQLGVYDSPYRDKKFVSVFVRFRALCKSGIRDIGIVNVDSGWEMYISGNGGIKTEGGAVPHQGQNQRSDGSTAARFCCTVKKAGTWNVL
jgi:NAD(P)H-nitrite reductase large subunit